MQGVAASSSPTPVVLLFPKKDSVVVAQAITARCGALACLGVMLTPLSLLQWRARVEMCGLSLYGLLCGKAAEGEQHGTFLETQAHSCIDVTCTI